MRAGVRTLSNVGRWQRLGYPRAPQYMANSVATKKALASTSRPTATRPKLAGSSIGWNVAGTWGGKGMADRPGGAAWAVGPACLEQAR